MKLVYNAIAGTSVERLAALSDGVFAVALTLLVLDIHPPAAEAIRGELDLWHAVVALSPRLLMYVMSFLTLGIFWLGQQAQLNHLDRSNRSLTWVHLVFLFSVSITPFSTALLAEFPAYRTALLLYWANILALGATLYLSWVCATAQGLVKADITPGVSSAIKRRVVIAQALYAFGAALCVFDTYLSIVVIVVVQLNYAIAPRIGRKSKAS
jgi:uncharacterized membrane protein